MKKLISILLFTFSTCFANCAECHTRSSEEMKEFLDLRIKQTLKDMDKYRGKQTNDEFMRLWYSINVYWEIYYVLIGDDPILSCNSRKLDLII